MTSRTNFGLRYVNKLAPMLSYHATQKVTIPTIHTFGFGFQIRSELMQSIAEVGKGSYAFIPDAGSIGTAFVHSVANLYSTMGTSAVLEIRLSNNATLESTAGMTLKQGEYGYMSELANLQHGQSRDLVFMCPQGTEEGTTIMARLSYKVANGSSRRIQASAKFSDGTALPQHLIHYHMHRAQICEFLSSLFPLKENNEHMSIKTSEGVAEKRNGLETLVAAIQSSPFAATVEVKSLLDDLIGGEPHGQVSKALMSNRRQELLVQMGPSLPSKLATRPPKAGVQYLQRPRSTPLRQGQSFVHQVPHRA